MKRKNEIHLKSAVPVLKSSDYGRSRHFFKAALGFELVEEAGSPARFGIFKRGLSTIFVDSWHGGPEEKPEGWSVYLHSSALDHLFAELKTAGAPILRPIEATKYGMREFEVTDPDGNILCFGEDLQPEDLNETD